MSIEISKKTISALAKSVSGDMKHTQKLDAFARVLGFRDQTAMMGSLKAAEPAAPEDASASENEVSSQALHGEAALAKHVEAALIKARDGWNAKDWQSDWRYEVDNGDTNQGYAGWGESMVEQRGEDITRDIVGALERLARGPRENETEEDLRKSTREGLAWALGQLTDVKDPACFNAPANESMKFIMTGLSVEMETHRNMARSEAANFLDLVEFVPRTAELSADPDDTPQP